MLGPVFRLSRFLETLKTTKRWWIPAMALTIVAVNLAGYLLPKKYESQALVSIHETQMEPLTGSASRILRINDVLKSIRERINSYDFLAKIASELKLDTGVAPNSPAQDLMIAKMKNSIDLRVKEQDLFVLAYRADTPEAARDITSAIVNKYISDSNSFYEFKTGSGAKLIESQLGEARIKLQAAQKDVSEYQNAHPNEIPEAQEQNLKRLSELRGTLQATDMQINGLRKRIELARLRMGKLSAEVISETTTAANPEVARLKSLKKDAELKLSMLLMSFTDEHWDVKETKATIEQLDKQIKEAQTSQVEQVKKSPNKIYQDMEASIEQDELEQERLKSQIGSLKKDIATYEQYMNNIAQRRGELDSRKNALYSVQSRIESLGRRLDEVRIAGELEKQGLGPSFKIEDYPRLSRVPVSPNRKKIGAASVALGIGISLAVAYLLTLMNSALRSVDEARQLLQMPMLGVIQRIVTAREALRLSRRRRRRVIGLSASLALLAVVVVLGLSVYREPLMHSVENIRKILNQW